MRTFWFGSVRDLLFKWTSSGTATRGLSVQFWYGSIWNRLRVNGAVNLILFVVLKRFLMFALFQHHYPYRHISLNKACIAILFPNTNATLYF